MTTQKLNSLFNTVILLALITIISNIFLYKLVPIEFYNLTRVIMFCSLLFLSYFHYKKHLFEMSFSFAVFSLLFNPLYYIYLGRTIWIGIDTLLIVFILFTFIKNKFFNKETGEIYKNDKVSSEILRIKKIQSKLESLSSDEWEDTIHLMGTKIGQINELITKELCLKFNIKTNSLSYEELRKELKSVMPKNAINDIYYINQFRNKIVHSNESDGYMDNFKNITKLDTTTKKYYNDEVKTVLNKIEAIYIKFLK